MSTAYSHGICVAVVNRTGVERGAVFPGQSCLANPWRKIATLGREEEKRVLEVPFDEIPRAKRPGPYNDLQTDHRMLIAAPVAAPRQSPEKRRGRPAPRRSSKKS